MEKKGKRGQKGKRFFFSQDSLMSTPSQKQKLLQNKADFQKNKYQNFFKFMHLLPQTQFHQLTNNTHQISDGLFGLKEATFLDKKEVGQQMIEEKQWEEKDGVEGKDSQRQKITIEPENQILLKGKMLGCDDV